ncbi:uncharacterized protein LOC123300286 isoform X2 [Chrysoperla carnea]|uniref:uncharacterized protein LOC123300286 isoform X2 n=1 Tax=Chrysoperla carnea TaxID=189513 RepID=UPI001D082AA3|nr:uncharacterized protein LOC123300286 isoform X2 [Chrysoperla carnea]
MACLDCWELTELGPPPNSIEFLPPPPLPAFLQRVPAIESLLQHIKGGNISQSPCAEQLCDRWFLGSIGGSGNVLGIGSSSGRGADTHPGGEYVDIPEQEWGKGSSIGEGEVSDTWLLVLIGCSIGVLLLGAVLALFLLRCREVILLAHRQHHQAKATISHNHTAHIEHCPQHPPGTQLKLPRGAETVLYPSHTLQNGHHADNRLLWAALTPRGGTQHYISENYPQGFMEEYGTPTEVDNTYETIENYIPTVTNATILAPVIQFKNNFKTKEFNLSTEKSSFDNSGFFDYDYEDPTPLIESYQLNDIENHDPNPYAEVEIGNLHQINTLGSTLRRASQIRPRISSPTRIENPNLPPLNLNPHSAGYVSSVHSVHSIHRGNGINTNGTLRRGTMSRRGSDELFRGNETFRKNHF